MAHRIPPWCIYNYCTGKSCKLEEKFSDSNFAGSARSQYARTMGGNRYTIGYRPVTLLRQSNSNLSHSQKRCTVILRSLLATKNPLKLRWCFYFWGILRRFAPQDDTQFLNGCQCDKLEFYKVGIFWEVFACTVG